MKTNLRVALAIAIIIGFGKESRAQSLDEWPLPPMADWPQSFDRASYFFTWNGTKWEEELEILPVSSITTTVDTFNIYRKSVGSSTLSFRAILAYKSSQLEWRRVEKLSPSGWSTMYVDSLTHSNDLLESERQYIPEADDLKPRRRITYLYDAGGRRTSSETYLWQNGVWTLGRSSVYTRDPLDRPYQVTISLVAGQSQIERTRITITYDSLGHPMQHLVQTIDHGEYVNSRNIVFEGADDGAKPIITFLSPVFDTLVAARQTKLFTVIN